MVGGLYGGRGPGIGHRRSFFPCGDCRTPARCDDARRHGTRYPVDLYACAPNGAPTIANAHGGADCSDDSDPDPNAQPYS